MVDAIRSPIGLSLPSVNAAAQAEIAQADSELQKFGKLKAAIRTGKPGAAAPESSRQEVEKAAVQFEAMLVKQMLGAMWQSVPKEGLLSGSNEEEIFRDMLNEALAETVAKSQGIGIKAVIRGELQKDKKR